MRIAVNGMGRIGRLLFRRLAEHDQFQIVAINDTMPVDNLAYLLKYDSVYGTFAGDIVTRSDSIEVDNKKIAVFQSGDPAKLPWKDLEIDVVLECTGSFTSKAGAENIYKQGLKKICCPQ